MHKSQEELQAALQSAGQQVIVGGLYTHYKNPEQEYKVIHLAITEWDDDLCVIYQAQYAAQIIFVRPLKSWLQKVEWQGALVDRFTKVSS
jgi:hypothetical protein